VTEDFDIIIVGSGAGGGTLAHTLAQTGKRILILERGGFLHPRRGSAPRERWFDAHGRPFRPAVHYCVGGATKMYGAALCRLRPMDFGSIGHIDGKSPAWPFGYAEFEPWYAKAEWLYQVHGLHGEDPTEGSWSADYLWPPVTHEPVIAQLAHELTGAGYQPFHTPTAVLFGELNRPDSHCARCAARDGVPCLLHAKVDADVIAVRPLLGLLNVTLLVDAEVTRLETDPLGRSVTGVVVNRAGSHEVYHGDVVVLAAGAVNSARILLRSGSDTHPRGLANGSGQVGRNLMCHNLIDVTAAAREPHGAAFPQTLCVNDFYLGGLQARWPLGSIQLRGPRQDEGRAITFRLTTEDLPRPSNRVTVDGQGRVGVAHVPTGDGAARLLYRSLRAMLGGTKTIALDILERPAKPDARLARYTDYTDCPDLADYAGTCRFGTDPATSVLDENCKAHELDNLYVVDTSFFPSIGAVRPALTVMANAIRVGDHLAARLGRWPSPRSAGGSGRRVSRALC
jgi:choline dehydrogenase-like flavoprotein